ncbi:MAG: hypothetical protein OEX18_05770 [Candidatus Krumholzibacteria bacterium]|nr:hypothetical protein [Candidatus Krumholzibacteria bacterium]MDH4336770.1 hypothetical protein [Candidatus Krumholzibacteria bacterium]MDH5269463.1 hypothetical protein [Candidatus Krumholzibacteria bacterium]MDH5627397.1 hypothetical protein [Candidatus Krumholzibacteria bacterium]
MRGIRGRVIALALGIAVVVACGGKDEPVEHMVLGEFVSEQDSFPRIRYFETGLVSINERCAVRKVKLNPKMPPVYVNGEPVGFC